MVCGVAMTHSHACLRAASKMAARLSLGGRSDMSTGDNNTFDFGDLPDMDVPEPSKRTLASAMGRGTALCDRLGWMHACSRPVRQWDRRRLA